LLYTGNHTATTEHIFYFFSSASVILVLIDVLGSLTTTSIASIEPPEIYFQPSCSSEHSHIIFFPAQLFLFILWVYNIHLHNIMPASVACIYVSITPEWFSLLQDALSREILPLSWELPLFLFYF
jgi:hypothetical protein